MVLDFDQRVSSARNVEEVFQWKQQQSRATGEQFLIQRETAGDWHNSGAGQNSNEPHCIPGLANINALDSASKAMNDAEALQNYLLAWFGRQRG